MYNQQNVIEVGKIGSQFHPLYHKYLYFAILNMSYYGFVVFISLDELHHQVSDCKAKGLLTISGNLPTVREVQKKHNFQTVITLDRHVSGHDFFGDMLRDDGSAYPAGLAYNVHEDLAAIMYSSGTTGLPKGVMLSHYNMLANVLNAMYVSDLFVGKFELHCQCSLCISGDLKFLLVNLNCIASVVLV